MLKPVMLGLGPWAARSALSGGAMVSQSVDAKAASAEENRRRTLSPA